MTGRLRLLMGAGALLLLAVAGGLGFLAWDWHAPYRGVPHEVLVTVAKGTRAGQVMEMLAQEGVVRSRISFKLAYSLYGKPRGLRAGTYKFDRALTPFQVIDKLNRGEVVFVKATIPEGLRADEVARVLSEAGLGREDAFLKAVSRPHLIRDLDPKAESLEGYLFPDTYLIDPAMNEEAVVLTIVKAFRQWWTALSPLSSGSLSLRETVILASLVEKETAAPSERPLIAGVFLNRLRIGMPLQTDPSIIYAQQRAGVYHGFLTRMDWGFPSAYNTYLHAGLPPGPLCSPGKASLAAALHPTPSPYLYFVSRNDGTHAFSKSLDEHNQAVARYRHKGGNGGPATRQK